MLRNLPPALIMALSLFCLGSQAEAVSVELPPTKASSIATPPQGFGAQTKGGQGGRLLRVTTLEDNPRRPKEGSLRWAIEQKGPRIVQFDVAGTIALEGPLTISEPFITIDGETAPAGGICIKDHALAIHDTNDVILRHLKIRRGDTTVLEQNRKEKRKRPQGSNDLDCVEMQASKNILIDHCSISWSCDELIEVNRCENVTVQWCILSEPLSNPAIHPYGDDHAFIGKTTLSTLTIHHCLLANYVMRGPKFSATASSPEELPPFDTKMEAINNVMFNYVREGSSYEAGFSLNDAVKKNYPAAFQFINNLYINKDDSVADIEVSTKDYGISPYLRIYVADNIGPNRSSHSQSSSDSLFLGDKKSIQTIPAVVRQLAKEQLFTAPVPVQIETAEVAFSRILEQAGAKQRDAVDERIVNSVKKRLFSSPALRSQELVGGWPDLTGGKTKPKKEPAEQQPEKEKKKKGDKAKDKK